MREGARNTVPSLASGSAAETPGAHAPHKTPPPMARPVSRPAVATAGPPGPVPRKAFLRGHAGVRPESPLRTFTIAEVISMHPAVQPARKESSR
jgi:hypothetical protein